MTNSEDLIAILEKGFREENDRLRERLELAEAVCEAPSGQNRYLIIWSQVEPAFTAWRAATQAKSSETGIAPTWQSDPG